MSRLPVLLVALLVWCAACGGGSDPSATEDTAAGPRSLTGDEANRLAAIRSNAYRAGVRSFDGVVANRDGSVQVRGWVDTVDHWAYGLVSGPDVTPFLAVWTDGAVSARDVVDQGVPPLPIPEDGWSTFPLDPRSSHLAAAQILLVSLANDRPDNAQLLRQDGATWLRQDRIDQTPVDVMTGPVPDGVQQSSYRYWVDPDGTLLRLEARLDGERWSVFDFTDSPDVELERPAALAAVTDDAAVPTITTG